MKKFLFMLHASCFILLIFLASPALAGGPFVVDDDGVAATWQNDAVNLHTEAGSCGAFTNAQMVAKFNTHAVKWADVSGVLLDVNVVSGAISQDLTINNYTNYWVDSSNDTTQLNDGINPMVFDADGSIVVELFGSSLAKYQVLGGSSPSGYLDDGTLHTIVDGEIVINCRCQANNDAVNDDCEGEFTEEDLNYTIVHEAGHLVNLDHNQINQAIADQVVSTSNLTGDEYCDAHPELNCEDIPTLYPVSEAPKYQKTLHRDDEVAVLTLYGNSSWQNSYFTITGEVLDSSGNPLRCTDVQASTSDTADTISAISGAFAPAADNNDDGDTADSGECTSQCGNFTLRGLDPAKSYTITVKPIDSAWAQVSGSSIAPCNLDINTGIVEYTYPSTQNTTAGNTIALRLATNSTGGEEAAADDDSGTSSTGCALNSGVKGNGFWFLALLMLNAVFLSRYFLKTPSCSCK